MGQLFRRKGGRASSPRDIVQEGVEGLPEGRRPRVPGFGGGEGLLRLQPAATPFTDRFTIGPAGGGDGFITRIAGAGEQNAGTEHPAMLTTG